jgi:hypothetical protein
MLGLGMRCAGNGEASRPGGRRQRQGECDEQRGDECTGGQLSLSVSRHGRGTPRDETASSAWPPRPGFRIRSLNKAGRLPTYSCPMTHAQWGLARDSEGAKEVAQLFKSTTGVATPAQAHAAVFLTFFLFFFLAFFSPTLTSADGGDDSSLCATTFFDPASTLSSGIEARTLALSVARLSCKVACGVIGSRRAPSPPDTGEGLSEGGAAAEGGWCVGGGRVEGPATREGPTASIAAATTARSAAATTPSKPAGERPVPKTCR